MLLTSLGMPAQKKQAKPGIQKGKASYYSKRSTGARTASGVRIHHDSLVCAHRTHPFGTLLRVKNLQNGKEVIVKVVDRGPYGRGRIIDLSYAAAKQLGMLSQGVGTVEVSVYYPDEKIPFKAPEYELPEMDFSVTEGFVPENSLDFGQKKEKDTKTDNQNKKDSPKEVKKDNHQDVKKNNQKEVQHTDNKTKQNNEKKSSTGSSTTPVNKHQHK